MKNLLLVALSAIPCVVSAASPLDEMGALMESKLSVTRELVELFSTVLDEATADAAAPRIKALTAKAEQISVQTAAIQGVTPEDIARLEERFQPRLPEISQLTEALSLAVIQMRLNDYYGSKALQAAMEETVEVSGDDDEEETDD